MGSLSRLIATDSGGPRSGRLPSIVTSSKTSSAYQVHSYPTKIPPEAITPFIEASTEPGAIILDPFCGSGMTGVAALLSGRSAVLSDLSPGAVHLARNHTSRVEPRRVLEALEGMERSWMRRTERSVYGAFCPTCGSPGVTRHVIWSDVYACARCEAEVVVWDVASGTEGHVPRALLCPRCRSAVPRAGMRPRRSEPAHIVVECHGGCRTLQDGPIAGENLTHLERASRRRVRYWVPSTRVEPTREMYKRSALHLHGIETVADFYLHRAKLALSQLWLRISQLNPRPVRDAMRFAFTNTAWHSSRMRRFNSRGGQRPLTGTLYIPQLVAEANVFEVFRHQVRQIAGFYGEFEPPAQASAIVRRSSATDLSWLPDGTIDYVFTDPPFGANIFYGDCNLVWEAWLRGVTDTSQEIVVNRSRSTSDGGKTTDDYGSLLHGAFAELRRVVRKDARVSIVFHNADDQVWAAMLGAAERSGLRQIEVSLLDKGQRSMKGYRGRAGLELVAFYDLVITFAPAGVRAPHLNGAGEIALKALREHLRGADRAMLPLTAQERSLEYLYSFAVASVIRRGAAPEGLSFRAFEGIANKHFTRVGRHFAVL